MVEGKIGEHLSRYGRTWWVGVHATALSATSLPTRSRYRGQRCDVREEGRRADCVCGMYAANVMQPNNDIFEPVKSLQVYK